ncbi:PaaI family thioesterase [Fodinisporobacter ferrooxydans]|uniref:PaaI family thioesterase n=1 Tax=Fodinisporobacter ferrooxydans TaxID=2901836 RepID=A0ABY4CJ33_9BACL|nr:PaaI family thioesterase [Alicyclobacillaceae bacterium MYW30-H2]
MAFLTREEMLQALQEFETEDLEKALQAAQASKLAREEQFYFLHYFLQEERIEDTENNQAVLTIPITDMTLNPIQMVHGGVTALLCDNAMGYASFLKAKRSGVTLNLNVQYHKPGLGKYLIAKADVIAEGSQMNGTRCEVRNETGTLVASATATFYHRK